MRLIRRVNRRSLGGDLLIEAGPDDLDEFRWFDADGLIGLATAAGFTVADCRGDFAGAPLTSGSEHFVLVLQRP